MQGALVDYFQLLSPYSTRASWYTQLTIRVGVTIRVGDDSSCFLERGKFATVNVNPVNIKYYDQEVTSIT